LVVGSGFAGLAAAIEAKNAGSSVIVLEKMNAPGGNSIISGGGIAAANTGMQRKAGIEDYIELMAQDMIKAGMGLNHPELVRELAARSDEAFRWSADYVGVRYLDRIDIFGGHTIPRCYTPEGWGQGIIKALLRKLDELGIEIRTKTCFKSFTADSAGRIKAATVHAGFDYKDEASGTAQTIQARKAVVLASGGFGADVPFRMAQDPRLNESVDTTNKPFATAEALKAALKIGAMPVHLSHIQTGPWASPDEKGYGAGPWFSDYVLFQYGIILNPKTGRRVVNELADRKIVSDIIFGIGEPCVGIADEAAVVRSGWDIGRAVEKGVVKKWETLGELASYYKLPLDPLEKTITRFNEYVMNKRDEEYDKPILPEASPITTPPFYAMRLWPKVHHTMGGVQINRRAQVIGLDQNPIAGLYAAGEVTGGIHGACRLGSCAITDCLVFGRIAGQNAARADR
jgi:flavocytochrome c